MLGPDTLDSNIDITMRFVRVSKRAKTMPKWDSPMILSIRYDCLWDLLHHLSAAPKAGHQYHLSSLSIHVMTNSAFITRPVGLPICTVWEERAPVYQLGQTKEDQNQKPEGKTHYPETERWDWWFETNTEVALPQSRISFQAKGNKSAALMLWEKHCFSTLCKSSFQGTSL